MSKKERLRLLAKAKRTSVAVSLRNETDKEAAERLRAAGDGFLVSQEWKALRQRVLDTYGWRCMRCAVVPRQRWRVNVDHIKPRLLFPSEALVFDNLQVLCCKCNKAKGNGPAVDYRPTRANG